MSYDVLAPSRRLKRKNFFRKTLLIFFVSCSMLFLAVGFFYIPYFKIEKVTFDGLKTIDKKALEIYGKDFLSQKKWGVIPYSNFFAFLFLDDIFLKNLLLEMPKIETALLKFSLPASITISVKERKTWATVCAYSGIATSNELEDGEKSTNPHTFPQGIEPRGKDLKPPFIPAVRSQGILEGVGINNKKCFYSGADGILFGEAPQLSGTVFFTINDRRDKKLTVGSGFLEKEELQKIEELVSGIEKTLSSPNIRILEISGDELKKYELVNNDGLRLIVDSKTNIPQAIENFSTAYHNLIKENIMNIDYIDLRLENKIFYKNK